MAAVLLRVRSHVFCDLLLNKKAHLTPPDEHADSVCAMAFRAGRFDLGRKLQKVFFAAEFASDLRLAFLASGGRVWRY